MQYEEQLRNSDDDPHGEQDQVKAKAVVRYYTSRMVSVSFTTIPNSNQAVLLYYGTLVDVRNPLGMEGW